MKKKKSYKKILRHKTNEQKYWITWENINRVYKYYYLIIIQMFIMKILEKRQNWSSIQWKGFIKAKILYIFWINFRVGVETIENFPGSSVVKNSPDKVTSTGDDSLIPGSRWSPGGGNGNPLQYSCWDNPIDRGAWWAMVHGVAKV